MLDNVEVLVHSDCDPGGPARIARLGGATIVDTTGDTTGDVVAYAAIVPNAQRRREAARTTAARTLSRMANVILSVSQDGPITVFHHGDAVLDLR